MTVDFGGGLAGTSQPAAIDRDTKRTLKIVGGADQIGVPFVDVLQLSALAGSPTPGTLNGCVLNDPDAPAALVDRVIDRLDDDAQARDRVVMTIGKTRGEHRPQLDG